ncbi:uncharacterized protein Z520_02440 [Fonsecaea multimorphosa CBS 102226]|uniref:FAD/NAD(P)-binding domain-containing protein n=1 Tax=Fonsecaea multimorphosa CBS 102226 TaxID=1442371 RepID=A0A0D2IZ29_9EURO|nr:uncharacterized protein Z520_02440 [Fonsecaea multimorphosa CBS 102226]KIY02302.1 hypothetical protein Z520_02440 [Fonsecaea multimorphosa CBS 102226]OAL28949.1 hypothetical protein AYO22_02385 [Fonsecaea multimorphosa]
MHDPTTASGKENFVDVLIIGAGISGINAAYRLQTQLPDHNYVILEGRGEMGGTWDLFRYPGIRSDSDLFTFGFSWHPWNQPNPIAEASAIRSYMNDSARLYGIDRHILYHHKVRSASYSSADKLWTLAVEYKGAVTAFVTRFLIFGTGYYDYDTPLQTEIPGIDRFQGPVVHPQFWPQELDYSDKKVVIIGSGATAITLLPSMARTAAKVTMLQRSPSYIVSMPNRSKTKSGLLAAILPARIVSLLTRFQLIVKTRLFYLFCRNFPNFTRRRLLHGVQQQIPDTVKVDPHFSPRYNPWDQRLCLCPDGDFFKALRSGKAEVKTDLIDTVQADGIHLQSGETLPADIIVTATGLKLRLGGGIRVTVDGTPFDLAGKLMWHMVLMQDLPNAAFLLGYTNASWTLGADASSLFLTRLLRMMRRKTIDAVIPRKQPDTTIQPRKFLDLNSTYLNRAEKDLPKTGDRGPWKARTYYLADLIFSKYGRIGESLEMVKAVSG